MIPSLVPSPATSVEIDGLHIVYDTFGDPDHPPLLLIAGLGNQLIDWREPFCSQLAQQGYWVIRFDNRDAGLSSRLDHAKTPSLFAIGSAYVWGTPIRAPYTLRDMAHDAVGILDRLGIESAHILGGSLGGMIAQTLAIHHPQRVRTLTSLMSTTNHPWLPLPRPKAWILFKPAPKTRGGYIEHQVRISRAVRGPQFPLDEQEIRVHAVHSYDRCPVPAGTLRQIAAVAASGSRLAGLKTLQAATLVIHGDADPLLPVQHAIHTSRVIPGARLLLISGMGHEFPQGAWKQVIEAVARHAV